MIVAGNHFSTETLPERRSQRAPLETYQEPKSRKGLERNIRKSQCQAWPISIAARENTRQREWQRRIKSQWSTKILHWHRRRQRTMAARVGRLQQQVCWHTRENQAETRPSRYHSRTGHLGIQKETTTHADRSQHSGFLGSILYEPYRDTHAHWTTHRFD